MNNPVCNTLRRLGVGKLALRGRQLFSLASVWGCKFLVARAYHLKSIRKAKPILVAEGDAEVHLLLSHKRIYEALWAVYSFVIASQHSCRVVIHDDGSLTTYDRQLLDSVLSGVVIISRPESDEAAHAFFAKNNLNRCTRLRETLIFSLKLFDPILLSSRADFFLIDSDVLFYRHGSELFEHGLRYSCDNGYRYCLPPQELQDLLGCPCVEHLNPGVMRIPRRAVNFELLEHWLEHPAFWTSRGVGNYYAELTLWAMLATIAGGRPLPPAYAICAPEPQNFVAGHYCGGGYWASLFYTRGIPFLKRRILA